MSIKDNLLTIHYTPIWLFKVVVLNDQCDILHVLTILSQLTFYSRFIIVSNTVHIFAQGQNLGVILFVLMSLHPTSNPSTGPDSSFKSYCKSSMSHPVATFTALVIPGASHCFSCLPLLFHFRQFFA